MSRIINNYFDGLAITPRHRLIYVVIMFAYFFEQFDNWNFGYVLPSIMQSMGLDMGHAGIITSWYFVGMMTGSIAGGILADMLGRRNALQLGVLIFSGSSVACGLADGFWLLTAARALTGFGIMCVNMSVIPYTTEISPAESRGKWQNLIAAAGLVGVPAVGVLCRILLPLHPEACAGYSTPGARASCSSSAHTASSPNLRAGLWPEGGAKKRSRWYAKFPAWMSIFPK